MHLKQRPRRLRSSLAIRELVCENELTVNDFLMPLFVKDGDEASEEISSMPGQFRLNMKDLKEKVLKLNSLGIKGVALFPVINESLKTKECLEAINKNGLYQSCLLYTSPIPRD